MAILLLSSVLTGLLAPAVVAMSKDGITAAAHAQGLSSSVKDFFVDVLEDALIRNAAIATVNSSNSFPNQDFGRKLFITIGTTDLQIYQRVNFQEPSREATLPPRLTLGEGFGTAGLQPLGP